MKDRYIIAITGQSGSGKSTFSRYIASRGYTVIDSDMVAREVHGDPDCLRRLTDYFGRDILAYDLTLDRKKLSRKAFASPEALQMLTDITHPYIIENILRKAENAFERGETMVFVDGAVIIGHSFERYCDRFIVVVTDRDIRAGRIMARDSISRQKAEERIDGQTPIEDMLVKADYVVFNNTTPDRLSLQGDLILRQLEKEMGGKSH